MLNLRLGLGLRLRLELSLILLCHGDIAHVYMRLTMSLHDMRSLMVLLVIRRLHEMLLRVLTIIKLMLFAKQPTTFKVKVLLSILVIFFIVFDRIILVIIQFLIIIQL